MCDWKAPFYFTLSIALAFMAVSISLRSPPEPNTPILHPLSSTASNVLHQSNFKAVAALLHISPEIFLSSPNTTVFAIADSTLFNTTLSPRLLKQLLQYHTLPSRLSMKDLLKKPQGICLPTLLNHKSLQLSTVNKTSRTVDVNHVRISRPDMFLGESLVIHGVLGPFASLESKGWDQIESSLCNAKPSSDEIKKGSEQRKIEWIRIIQLLSSNGFVSFAIALNSVVHRIVQDYKNLSSVTVLATTSLDSLSSASPLLYQVVRHHVLDQRLTFEDFGSLPDKAKVKTLDPNQDLKIIRRDVNSSKLLFLISGVEIVVPDMFSFSNFVIHGISHTLEIPRDNVLV